MEYNTNNKHILTTRTKQESTKSKQLKSILYHLTELSNCLEVNPQEEWVRLPANPNQNCRQINETLATISIMQIILYTYIKANQDKEKH